MTITVTPVPLAEVLPLRELYRQEMNCQIVHDSLPERKEPSAMCFSFVWTAAWRATAS